MIIDAILHEVYGNKSDYEEAYSYKIPENLKHFYDTMKANKKTNDSCCSPNKSSSCC